MSRRPAREGLRVEIAGSVDPSSWDALAASVGGGFFHCHAYATYDACYPGTSPIFAKAMSPDGALFGVAVGTVATPGRWPFSRVARTVSFGALPAAAEGSPESKAAVLAALEKPLAALGIHQAECKAYDSEGSGAALDPLGYRLRDRAEFHLDLGAGAGAVWDGFKSERRTAIRKAEKQGLASRMESGPEAVRTLFAVQAEALGRKGVVVDASEGLARATVELLRKGHGQLWITTLDGEPLNAALLGLHGKSAYYLASGSTPKGFKLAGPAHLVWTVIQHLAEREYARFNLAGAPPAGPDPSKVDGLHRFKKDFGSRVAPQPAGVRSLGGLGAFLAGIKSRFRP
jgi:hypothetical protein